ncbi:MAG: Rne/Rng family ribonuclease [Rhizobiaceae bacterium]|nr:Rne/Rng family ribonuclease [Rhizobiaceae bacterium]MCV0407188.1 Rne/Rng family ribonuclease [Rhizobiaceae bacterium]
MPNKMLIDASHPEETRVVVVRGNRIEEFDFESQDKKQLKGNIYLARVTRVEPSLQAAFVEYGGNRHGFLAFSEIHPDYYQIPVADRQALLEAEAEAAQAEDDEDEDGKGDDRGRGRRRRRRGKASGGGRDRRSDEASADASDSSNAGSDEEDGENGDAVAAAAESDAISEDRVPDDDNGNGASASDDGEVESVGAEDAIEEVRARRKPMRRTYKIQEVIKRRQILLVQVVKEERGNKGAALTTYLSLAGRYSVLMPNTARGGGISRKITSAQDRKRLKDIVRDLDVPQGMGVILRTAGESRTKAEIKRDYEYLMRMWENVRNLTLQSSAPALVYEEGSLIKRSVRDLYNKDIGEILVSGDEGYREAKDFMRMLMPSHAKAVQPYRDTIPIFARNGIEAQLDRMLQPQVTLKSGGYIIINQTEALVSIDVNSGRSTREHSIEDTALQTNLEAAEEVARQLRLRDLAGLIVIDFIDMEENRNNRAVEKKMKDCLKNDRARIQVGRISHFGLLEMSRQRIRASVLESTMKPCPHCGGAGHVRSDSSIALHVIRAIEEFLLKDNRSHLIVKVSTATALYVLNQKRGTLVDLESRFGLTITLEADDTVGAQLCTILRGQPVENPVPLPEITAPALEPEEEEEPVEAEDSDAAEGEGEQPQGDDERGRKRRKRRRRRGGRDRDDVHQPAHTAATSDTTDADEEADGETASDGDEAEAQRADGDGERRKRRRGKRGGRRNRRDEEASAGSEDDRSEEEPAPADNASFHVEAAAADVIPAEPDATASEPAPEPAPDEAGETPKKPARRSRKKKAEPAAEAEQAPQETADAEPVRIEIKVDEPESAPAESESAAEPEEAKAPSRRRAKPAQASAEPVVYSGSKPADNSNEEKPKKAGWWQRKGFF